MTVTRAGCGSVTSATGDSMGPALRYAPSSPVDVRRTHRGQSMSASHTIPRRSPQVMRKAAVLQSRMPRSRLWYLSLASLLVACASDHETSDDPVSIAVEPIIGGVLAVDYPEAAVLDIDRGTSGTWYACSATLIAPRAVLTAGHCIDTHSKWSVQVHGEVRVSTTALTYDWAESGAQTVNPNHHDIGLVFLDEPIALAMYPTLANAPLADGSAVVNVGRILDGTFTWSSYQARVVVRGGATFGYPFDYESSDVIQPGDSGGAVMAEGTHRIVAVNSGAGNGIQVLARVDLLRAWIDQQVAAHTPSPPPSAPPSPPPPPPSDCTAEIEPNGSVQTATTIAHRACGALSSSGDVDWVTFTVAHGATTLQLSADDDAVFSIGKLAYGRCNLLATGRTGARLTTSGRSTALCARISSPSHRTQAYTLSVR